MMCTLKYYFDPQGLKPYINTFHCVTEGLETVMPLYIKHMGIMTMGRRHYTEREGDLHSYQIMFTESGYGEIAYMGKNETLTENTLCIIDMNRHQYYKTGDCDWWKYYHICFRGAAGGLLTDTLYKDGFCVTEIPEPEMFYAAFRNILENVEKRTICDHMTASARLYDLLISILKLHIYPSTREKNGFVEALQSIDRYVKENKSRKITLDDLSAIAFLSPRQLQRKFKAHTGLTPHAYVTALRIQEMKKMLADTEITITDIAQMFGYPSLSGFIIHFKTATGVTPSEWRKRSGANMAFF